MAKKAAASESKLTKASLMKEIDIKLQGLNLVKSVLQTNPHPKKEELESYRKQFQELMISTNK
jgi:hypothetical protein